MPKRRWSPERWRAVAGSLILCASGCVIGGTARSDPLSREALRDLELRPGVVLISIPLRASIPELGVRCREGASVTGSGFLFRPDGYVMTSAHVAQFANVTDEEFERILHTNLRSVFAVSREVVRVMIPQGQGNIINISSMAAQYGIPKVIAYTASKSAIEGMTKAMAVELSPKGILVNCIAPGFIATDMSSKALNGDAERKQKVFSRTPLGRLGDPADIGDAALFLASPQSKYVTGVILPVDGGNSVGF